MNKKGAFGWWVLLVLVIALIFVVYYWSDIKTYVFSDRESSSKPFSEVLKVENPVMKPILTLLGYIFGGVPDMLVKSSGAISALIIVIAIWIMMALIFGDIIRNFSSLGSTTPAIPWVIAALMAIIGANLKFVVYMAVVLATVFLPLGVFAAYAGLLAAFVAFFAVEWGISSLGPFIMRRKAFKRAATAQTATQAMVNAMRHYKTVGQELQGKTNPWKTP